MVGKFLKAVGQLDDPRVRGVVLGSFVATLVLFCLVGVFVVLGLGYVQLTGVPVFEWLIEVLGAAAVVLFAWFAFPAFMGVIASLFLDKVVDAVEDRHYPGLPAARNIGVSASIMMALRFAGVVLLVNLVALPFYVVFLFFPVLSFALFLCVNGYLLGREYFELVAARRMDTRASRGLFRANRSTLFLAGVVVALLTTVPIVNLLAPVVATAFVTHVYHELADRAPVPA